jgi:hypothetical protein
MAQYIGADGGSLGPWAGGVKNRFLGLQFMIKGKKHFGWARLSASTAPYQVILTGYAYETIANKPIIAGKTKVQEKGSPIPATSNQQPTGLAVLALGSSGMSIWRRKEGVKSTAAY